MLKTRIPAATYRLQFNRSFRFPDAKAIIGYLNQLGISDIYSSPYLGAKKGSLHGYDIVDHNVLNPEIGTREEYEDFTAGLREFGMGQILDIVPNHMGIGNENAMWMDLLENGQSSVFDVYFDVDWEPVKRELKDKVLLPVLGAQYGIVLENKEITLSFHEGAFFISYYEHRFPVRPQTYTLILKHGISALEELLTAENPHLTELLSIITAIEHLPSYTEKDHEKVRERHREKEIIKKRLSNLYSESSDVMMFIDNNVRLFNGVKGDPRSFDLLDNLISEQVYRLSFWRVATEEINYRRFFDINELAAICVENEEVFQKTHKLVMELVGEGKVTGLRVDHPDGLYDPAEYFRRLQRYCFIKAAMYVSSEVLHDINAGEPEQELLREYVQRVQEDPLFKPFYIVGEKILIRGERMPEGWPIFSTTGYVFLNTLNGIFIDTTKAKDFDGIYSRFIREDLNYQEIVYEKKKLIMLVSMSSEINTIGHYLNAISEKDRHTRDFTLNSLTDAIIEVIAFFPVYRTYINQYGANDRDRKYIEYAVAKAKRKNPAISESIYDFLKNVLHLNFPEHFSDEDKKEWIDFVMTFQQITGPVMAKGVEDTACYVYNRFVSLNEVGGSPDRFGTTLDTFHGQNIERFKFWPHAMIATSTHDTKRGEDVRTRINVLSEIPGEWKDCLFRWSRLNKRKKMAVADEHVPERNEEYLLYQTMIGAWPENEMDKNEYEGFKSRIKDYMLKAVREAKVNSSWISPNTIYEEALIIFIERVMEPYPDSAFLRDLLPFQKKVSHYGMFNSLSQTLLKITSPGAPDFYQGTEIWNFSLVDPDNRRPVDYPARIKMLEEMRQKEAEIPLQQLARELTENMDSGAVKLYLISRALNFRRQNRELFEKGEYIPLEAQGRLKDNVCAFARKEGGRTLVIAAPRFYTRVAPVMTMPLGEAVWGDTHIAIPFMNEGRKCRNIFTGEDVTAVRRDGIVVLHLSDVLGNFPVALLNEAV
ncbi:MAG: malto-oligosyltrehalose synthase [Nitrospiraceae bacterium]|nr:MAG: malto-oligosyltrehalose synthase [Nitrospiraceae bacterium]